MELKIAYDDLGFLMGVTITERLRTFRGQAFRVNEHIDRLRHSLEIVGWDATRICENIGAAVNEFSKRNANLVMEGDDWNIVGFVTPGRTTDAANPTLGIYGFPIPFSQWAHQYRSGVDAIIADVRQVPANCWPPELKCRSRLHYYLADRQAAQRSPDTRAILLDQQGNIGEGSTANVIAFFKGSGLVTPLLDKVLPGVSQQVLLELAELQGIPCHRRDITPQEFAEADEIFFTSTSICLLPVVRLNDFPVGDGRPGPLFTQFLNSWSELVGVNIAAQAQLFAVR